jgi:hypothetical protein
MLNKTVPIVIDQKSVEPYRPESDRRTYGLADMIPQHTAAELRSVINRVHQYSASAWMDHLDNNEPTVWKTSTQEMSSTSGFSYLRTFEPPTWTVACSPQVFVEAQGQSTARSLNLPWTGLTNTEVDCPISNSCPGTDVNPYVFRAASVTKPKIHAHGF